MKGRREYRQTSLSLHPAPAPDSGREEELA